MQRREWVKTWLAASVMVGALAWAGREALQPFRSKRSPPRRSDWQLRLERELRAALSRHVLDDVAVDKFLADAERYQSFLADESSRRVDLAGRFLLSTDFFQRGAQRERPAHYVAFFHPWVTPCSNPFTKPH